MRAASCATPEWANRQFSRPRPTGGRPLKMSNDRPQAGRSTLLPGPTTSSLRSDDNGSESCGDYRRRAQHEVWPRNRPAAEMSAPIRMVALDMAGTTVADAGAVEEAFQRALDSVGLTAGELRADPQEYVRRTMGQSKITVFTELLGGDRHRADEANSAFEAAFDQAVDRGEVAAVPGAESAMRILRD